MAKHVTRFGWAPWCGLGVATSEVFVRARLTGSTTWSPDGAERTHEITLSPTFLDAGVGRRAVVSSADIVAMVHDDAPDAKYGAIDVAEMPSRLDRMRHELMAGPVTSFPNMERVQFDSPAMAAQWLAEQGWTVFPPDMSRESIAAAVCAHLATPPVEDAHVEPIGDEGPWFVQHLTFFAKASGHYVINRATNERQGPYQIKLRADERAAELNEQEAAR